MNRRKKQINVPLKEILAKYKEIQLENITSLSMVYYPIANIEIDIIERSFEDFDMIQLAILRLFNLGQINYLNIANLLGLSDNYVFRVLNLLRGYGLIDDNSLMDLGRESLNQGKRIVDIKVSQKFKIDALNGNLLKIKQIISEKNIVTKKSTEKRIGILDNIAEISLEQIIEQLNNSGYEEFISTGKPFFNRNILAINEIRFLKINYSKAIMIGLTGVDVPIVFSKRYDVSRSEISERFSWLPFALPNEEVRKLYGFEESVILNSKYADLEIRGMHNLIKQNRQKLNDEELKKILCDIYPFNMSEILINKQISSQIIFVDISFNSLKVFHEWIFELFIEINRVGFYLHFINDFYDEIIIIKTKDERIKIASELFIKKIKEESKEIVISSIIEKINCSAESNIIEDIISLL